MFILLEGPEGGGKTTQAKLLVDSLAKEGKKARYLKCPGQTEIGLELRKLALISGIQIEPLTHLLLMCADMYETSELVKKCVEEGFTIVMDRYYPSSVAYSTSQGLDKDRVVYILDRCEFKRPDLTIVLDIDPAVGLKRKEVQGEVQKFELMGNSFHEKVRNLYIEWAEEQNESKDGLNVKVINTNNLSYDDITNEINKLVKKYK